MGQDDFQIVTLITCWCLRFICMSGESVRMDSVRREGLPLFLVSLRGFSPRMLLVTCSTLYSYLWRWNMLLGKRQQPLGHIAQWFWAWGMGLSFFSFPRNSGVHWPMCLLYWLMLTSDVLPTSVAQVFSASATLTFWPDEFGLGVGWGLETLFCVVGYLAISLGSTQQTPITFLVMLAQNISRYCSLH